MQLLNSFSQLPSSYEYFVFDVWGVLHDGSKPYPGAIETIKFLRKQNKKVCFLSNAPRRSSKVSTILQSLGFTPDLYDFILTSGEAAFLDLKKNQEEGFKDFGKKYIYIGPQKDIDLLQGLNYEKVEDASKADIAITTGFDGESSTLAEKMPQAIEARKHNLPMICVNPDMIVVRQDGSEMICAGALAREYEKMNGKVFYYGKPFSAVYKMTCELFNNPEKEKIIAIGDGLETDIKGANDFGIDSILVTGGILSNHLNIKYWENADLSKLEKVCGVYKSSPKFVISNLKL